MKTNYFKQINKIYDKNHSKDSNRSRSESLRSVDLNSDISKGSKHTQKLIDKIHSKRITVT